MLLRISWIAACAVLLLGTSTPALSQPERAAPGSRDLLHDTSSESARSERTERIRLLRTLAATAHPVGDPAQIDGLVRTLARLANEADEEVSFEALRVLSALGPDAAPVFLTLQNLARSTAASTRVRAQALDGIYRIGDAEVTVTVMRHLLSDRQPEIRLLAAVALWKTDGRRIGVVLPVLIGLLEDSASRPDAVAILTEIGADASAALPALESLRRRRLAEGAAPQEIAELSAAIRAIEKH